MKLPMEDQSPAAGGASPATPRSLRVLMVEDNPDDEELIVLELESGGYQVEHIRVETEAAMVSALKQPWEIILSDFSLPEFSGQRALDVVKRLGIDIPFIIVSGTVGEDTAVAAMRSGANDYVLKKSLVRLCAAVARETREASSRAEQRKMRDRLLISDRMASVGTLAAGVAHEINNPLTAVIANLELIASDVDSLVGDIDVGPQVRGLLLQIRDAREGAERLRQIVRDLKLFSRSSDEERFGPVDIKRTLESSLRMAWNEIRHRARLVKEFSEVPAVGGNEARLGQVFLNLIVNAAQAIREGNADNNVIRVATRHATDSGRVVVEISDTGDGIADEHLPHIFDAFFTTKPIGVGTGLGLSICHKIVTDLRGTIEVESKVGKGTLFRLSLPAFAGKTRESRSSLPAIPARRRGRVLIIDDEAIVARALAGCLQSEHDVVVSLRAEDAIAFLAQGQTFDVILCDLMMPQVTGMDLYARLVQDFPDHAARIVFMTGGAFTPAARSFLDAHANDRVAKPIEGANLRALVNARIT